MQQAQCHHAEGGPGDAAAQQRPHGGASARPRGEGHHSGRRQPGRPAQPQQELTPGDGAEPDGGDGPLHRAVRGQPPQQGTVRGRVGDRVLQGQVDQADHDDDEHPREFAAQHRRQEDPHAPVRQSPHHERTGHDVETLRQVEGTHPRRGVPGRQRRRDQQHAAAGQQQAQPRIPGEHQTVVEPGGPAGGEEHHEPDDQREGVQRPRQLRHRVRVQAHRPAGRAQEEPHRIAGQHPVGEIQPQRDEEEHQNQRQAVPRLFERRVAHRRPETPHPPPHAPPPAPAPCSASRTPSRSRCSTSSRSRSWARWETTTTARPRSHRLLAMSQKRR